MTGRVDCMFPVTVKTLWRPWQRPPRRGFSNLAEDKMTTPNARVGGSYCRAVPSFPCGPPPGASTSTKSWRSWRSWRFTLNRSSPRASWFCSSCSTHRFSISNSVLLFRVSRGGVQSSASSWFFARSVVESVFRKPSTKRRDQTAPPPTRTAAPSSAFICGHLRFQSLSCAAQNPNLNRSPEE
jgi:hypothetical protein